MKSLAFHLGLAAFFTHELDAMREQEWRLLYVLRTLDDDSGAFWFLVLHVPLFAAITALTMHAQPALRLLASRILAVFFLFHAGLHWRLMGNPLAPFDSTLSLLLIHGCALCGVIYLMLNLRRDPIQRTNS